MDQIYNIDCYDFYLYSFFYAQLIFLFYLYFFFIPFIAAGSLSDFQTKYLQFKSCDAEQIDLAPIFSSLSRPVAVDKLRDSAHGPSPPVVISCGMVASEVEDLTGTISSSNSSTHIYCKPVKVIKKLLIIKLPYKMFFQIEGIFQTFQASF